jgi:hypothetical protein
VPRDRRGRATDRDGKGWTADGGSDAPRAAALWLLAPRFGARSFGASSGASALSVFHAAPRPARTLPLMLPAPAEHETLEKT